MPFNVNKEIKVCLGWDESPPSGHVVSWKNLRDEGLHMFQGMIGYYLKDNMEEHFEFVHHNVLAETRMKGKWGTQSLFNNCVSLS